MLCLTYFVYLFTFLGFGYAINDYSDREIDKKVGKTNIMADLPGWKCNIILILLVSGCLPFAIMTRSNLSVSLLLIVYFFGAAYSVEPFRFKEKGVAGLLVSSFAQRAIPLLPLIGILKSYWSAVFVSGAIGFFVGLRYILIHQYEDIENDKLTGVETYALNHESNIATLIYGSLFFEIVLVFFLELFFMSFFVVYALTTLCIIQSIFAYHTIQHIYQKNYFLSFICVPFEDLYNFYLPLSLLICLSCQNPVWIFHIIMLIVISTKEMKNKLKIAVFGMTHWR